MSPLYWKAQNWTQYSRCGLIGAEERGRITSLDLLATVLPMQPSRLLVEWHHNHLVYQALLPSNFAFVCKFAEGTLCPIIQDISEDVQQCLAPVLTTGVHLW